MSGKIEDILGSLYKFLVASDGRVIKKIVQLFQYNDEPKFWLYHAAVNVRNADHYFGVNGEGFSVDSKDDALLKSIVEGIERFCLYKPPKKFMEFTLDELDKSEHKYLDPREMIPFSKNQLKNKAYAQFIQKANSKYGFVRGVSVLSGADNFIPAQLVYLNYKRLKSEPVIQLPLSTGAAAGSSISLAILSGICECIERDAFMIAYLTKFVKSEVDITSHPDLKIFNDLALRYRSKIRLFDITNDISVPTYWALYIDETGIGPALTVGASASLNQLRAMKSALEESLHSRTWIRSHMNAAMGKEEKRNQMLERGLYWSKLERLKKLSWLLEGNWKKKTVDKIDEKNKIFNDVDDELEYICSLLESYEIFYVDITRKDVLESGIKVVKVIIPGLQPLYLDERYPYLGGGRLQAVARKRVSLDKSKKISFNTCPHPFL